MQRRRLLGWAALASAVQSARAQGYPERPIKIYQGFAPGGNADTIARLIGAELGKGLGQPVVVEAQAGAGGSIAATSVARARPDGYTLLLATGGHAVAGALYQKLAYRTVSDFEMISTITFFPFLLVVPADSKHRNLSTLMSEAQARPGSVSYGTAGVGSTHHLAGELLARMAKVEMQHVPYRGDSASITAALAGDIPLVIAPPTAVMPHLKAGKLRALAVTSAQRWSLMPELPTVAEQGVTGFEVSSWAALMAPAGTPRPVVERLNAEVRQAVQLTAMRARLADMGGEPRASTPDEMKTMVSFELQRWTQLVAESNIPKQ
ncbi:tripartite tricarboxylate transporter substrate binding protein [Curvibacter sp. RS43]|uniref:tripartite tricarboxylate transporter substrate binding protein n=1 Tax=Curvibacter microcysteis TaxID=3026419 RepID=UPI0023609BBE|nr:tripartite tricarboxylate transporter substrate binding protein [Curvibacter sp. RS43]MDD0812726.1 tripartite tricarboxylate transporter substrate binding protein [Curvibacter sp. RS43]